MKNINDKIKKYLLVKGIKNEFLVQKTGISKQNISRILNAEDIKMSIYFKICDALNVKPDYFFSDNFLAENTTAFLVNTESFLNRVKTPSLPNFINIDGLSTDVKIIKPEYLKIIGEKWTEELINHSKKRANHEERHN